MILEREEYYLKISGDCHSAFILARDHKVMIHLILVGTEDPGNVGAIARLMANFSQEHLLFIEPQCNPLHLDAIKRAKHAKHLIEKAPLVEKTVLEQFDLLIGTTAKIDSNANVRRTAHTVEEAMKKVAGLRQHVGILFGPESIGLTNEYLDRCDMLMHIPTSAEYPSLNLSHAVGVVLYELSRQRPLDTLVDLCDAQTKQHLLECITRCFKAVDTTRTPEYQQLAWKRILGSSLLTKKEAEMLFGFFRSIEAYKR
jgi:tRNA/rRNA methyltransferase